jgi:hypothetical protein
MFLRVLRGGRAGPVNQVEVDVVELEILQRGGKPFPDTLVERVVKFGCDPYLLTGHARCLDAFTNLSLVAVFISTGSC